MYIQIDEDFQEHPKSRRLCRILMDPRGWSWCVLLWRYCTKFHQDGDLTEVEPADLEYNLGWTLDEGKLFAALVTAGFIDQVDGKITVHDWMEYQGSAIVKMREARDRKRAWRATGVVPSRRADDETDVSTRNLVSVHRTSPGRPGDNQGRPGDNDGTSVVSIAEHSKASETECCEPVAATDSQPASASGDAPKKRKPRQPAPPDGTPVIRTVACNGPIQTWDLTEGYVAKVQAYFPGKKVREIFMGALFWLDANPDRRKTAGGMESFLARWLARANDTHAPMRGPPVNTSQTTRQMQYPLLGSTKGTL